MKERLFQNAFNNQSKLKKNRELFISSKVKMAPANKTRIKI